MRDHILLIAFCLLIALIQETPARANDSERKLPIINPGVKEVPDDLQMRARVVAIQPPQTTSVQWRWGGEGLMEKGNRGVVANDLRLQEWSPFLKIKTVAGLELPDRLFLTLTCGSQGKAVPGNPRVFRGYSTGIVLEFEFSNRTGVLKRFKEVGPNGGTVTIVIPLYQLKPGRKPITAEFLRELTGIHDYARLRLTRLKDLSWMNRPVPRRYPILTDLAGYGESFYNKIRTTNPETMKVESETLRLLGINGLSSAPDFLVNAGESYFRKARWIGSMGFPVPLYVQNKPDPEAGCPFGPGVEERTRTGVAEALDKALKQPVEEVWARTVDEIGTVIDRSKEGKGHLAVCDRCAAGFRDYLTQQGLKPSDFGYSDWIKIRPMNIWTPDTSEKQFGERSKGLLAYYTAMFNNFATAKLFTPLRDAFARANQSKESALASHDAQNSNAAHQPWIYSFALRGNTFLLGGHSLDFFDFYRYADNAFVFETSNRDPRIWGWDSYLCDVGRVVSDRQKISFGIYIKPHRGAPIQRALTALSRNAKMIYWYTYGPDWAMGDDFSDKPELLAKVSQADRLIAAAEDTLYDSTWEFPARIAVVNPRSSEIWMRISGGTAERNAAWENAKWIYSALSHAHLSVDPIDERGLAEGDLSKYRLIYINGANLTAAAAKKVAQWVENGGTLFTSGGGLRFDEANQPLKMMLPVLGLRTREKLQMWKRVELYPGDALEPYADSFNKNRSEDQNVSITGGSPFNASFPLMIGREILQPMNAGEILGTFSDGGAAVVRHTYGKGRAYTIGFFPGLEYSAPLRQEGFDMLRDLSEERRNLITVPAMEIVRPEIEIDQPSVEAILLRNRVTGKRAVTVMNWTYRMIGWERNRKPIPPVLNFLRLLRLEDDFIQLLQDSYLPAVKLVPFSNIKLTIHDAEPCLGITSCALRKTIPVEHLGNDLSVTLPQLEEGDVLLLD